MNQILVTIHASFLIPRPGVNDRAVSQHSPPFIGKVENVAMTFFALFVLETGIGLLPGLFMVVFSPRKVDDDILDAMGRLGVKKIESIMGSGKMAVHAVRDETLGVIDMGGGLPGVIGKLDFVAGGTEPGGGGADHGKVGHAEQREGNNNADGDENNPLDVSFHIHPRQPTPTTADLLPACYAAKSCIAKSC